jgi:predicted Fe-Mo cluster-binding NifX family protein
MTTRKIAFVTDDGQTISQHFGRALYYQVLTIEDGEIVAEEQRDKLGHYHFAGQKEHDVSPLGHGMSARSQSKHASMAAAIADCEALITRGMGRGAYLSLEEANITPFVTDLADIRQAAQAYIDGTLDNLMEKLH